MATDASAAQEAFEQANQAAYAANLAYSTDPTPSNLTAARELNRQATAAAYAAHDAREHAGGPCDCYTRRISRKAHRYLPDDVADESAPGYKHYSAGDFESDVQGLTS